jgi:hypothetical protein
LLLLALALGSFWLSSSAGADSEAAETAHPLEWDQAYAATLAENFYEAVKELRTTVRESATGAVAGRQDRVRHQALDKLAHLERSARQLAPFRSKVSRGHLINPSVARRPSSARSLRCEISP